MATLEEVLAALNSATTNAREVLTKIPQIATSSNDVSFTFADGTQITLPGLQKLKAEVDGFIAGARGEFPVVSILSNVVFEDSNGDGIPDDWAIWLGADHVTNSEVLELTNEDINELRSLTGVSSLYTANENQHPKKWKLTINSQESMNSVWIGQSISNSKVDYAISGVFKGGCFLKINGGNWEKVDVAYVSDDIDDGFIFTLNLGSYSEVEILLPSLYPIGVTSGIIPNLK